MKRTMIKALSIVCIILSSVIMNVSAQKKNDLPSLDGKNVLIVYGGWEGHAPKAYVDKITPWLKSKGAEVTISQSVEIYLDEDVMNDCDLIIQSVTMDNISDDQVKALCNAVKRGVGLAGCHGGIGDSFRDKVDFQYMVGGQWVAHPGGEIDHSVTITDKKNPISKGLSNFNIHTEQYYMHVDPSNKVLATTTFSGDHNSWIEGAVIPVAWKRYFGEGRVFYLSLGHSPEVFDVPEVWALMTRGICWAANSKYGPKEDLVSPAYK